MAKRITMSVLQSKCPERIREIEMAIDSAVLKSGVSIQFWKDVQVDGLRGAYMSLRSYAEEGYARIAEVDEKIIPLCEKVIAECNRSDYPGKTHFRRMQEAEGNGFDHIAPED